MKKFLLLSIPLALVVWLVPGCQKDTTQAYPSPKVAQGEYDYVNLDLPDNFFQGQDLDDFFQNFSHPENPLTNEGATLGRVLFYDWHLSKNNLIACASCHVQRKGFADPAQFSTGFKLAKTTRNSMAISNVAFLRTYFWDSRATVLEEQVMMPVQNHIEMGIEKLALLPEKLSHVEYYPELFEAAFGDSAEITEQNIRFALAQFLRSMVSFNSKFDEGRENGFDNFTELENLGRSLFMDWDSRAGCANCHNGVVFDGWGERNIGLDAEVIDEGAEGGQFKVPSLRNIAVTAPYMHDGRFQTLEEVIDHYDHGVQANPFLDWELRDSDGGAKQLNLTPLEKKALVAFLKTLTDEQYLTDPKFSDPFK